MVYPDLLVHLNRGLDQEHGKELAGRIKGRKGVVEVRFNPRKKGFLHVWYDPAAISAGDIRDLVTKEGHEAVVAAL